MSCQTRNAVALAAAAISAALFVSQTRAGTYQTITIDGNTSEWSTVPVALSAAANPAAPIDITQLKMANDANFIYFELTFNGSTNPQSGGGVYLGIDSDNSGSTGFNIYGNPAIGANLAYQNDTAFTQTASNFNSGLTNATNATYAASPYNTPTVTQEISIPINASQVDTSPGGYTGNVFQTPTNSFTVEFYTTESTVSVLGPFTYTIAAPPSQATYTTTGSGDYNSAGNWSAAVPNGVDAEADFVTQQTGNHTVYSDSDITLGKLVFNNAYTYVLAGAGSLTMASTSGTAVIDAQAGTQKVTLPTTLVSNTILNADSGATLVMGGPVTVNSGVSVTEPGAGSVVFQSTLTLNSGASVALAAGTHTAALSLATASNASIISETGSAKTALELDSLSMAAGSTFNLNNGDLIVQNGNLTAVQQSVKTGLNAGGTPWTGAGITSSAAANDPSQITALGVIPNSLSGAALYTTFDGTAVNASDVLVKYTYYGDSNLDGKIDGTDYSRIDNGYLTHATGWLNGDFNYDGVVDGSDYTLIDNAYNSQGSQIGASPSAQITDQIASQLAVGSTSAVPEPASIGMLMVGALGLLGRRQKNR
jgi:hypothetical protein